MRKSIVIIIVAGLVVVAGGLVFLANWDIRPATNTVEKTVPDDRLPR